MREQAGGGFTLIKGDSVIRVNKKGICVFPNDVPAYDKDQFMPEDLKDEKGKALPTVTVRGIIMSWILGWGTANERL